MWDSYAGLAKSAISSHSISGGTSDTLLICSSAFMFQTHAEAVAAVVFFVCFPSSMARILIIFVLPALIEFLLPDCWTTLSSINRRWFSIAKDSTHARRAIRFLVTISQVRRHFWPFFVMLYWTGLCIHRSEHCCPSLAKPASRLS